jgi:hypothetical protein
MRRAIAVSPRRGPLANVPEKQGNFRANLPLYQSFESVGKVLAVKPTNSL